MLIVGMVRGHRNSHGVDHQELFRFVELNSMIRQIRCCFLFIPLEFHAYDITANTETCSV
jgi:hypothetical protein